MADFSIFIRSTSAKLRRVTALSANSHPNINIFAADVKPVAYACPSMSPSPFSFLVPCLLLIRQDACSQCIRVSRQQPRRSVVSTAAKILNIEKPNPESYTPRPLLRPIGVPDPPKPGENSGIDPRTWREKRADMFNYDKHLIRREQLYAPSSLSPNQFHLPASFSTHVVSASKLLIMRGKLTDN